jgi:hypothetical protein
LRNEFSAEEKEKEEEGRGREEFLSKNGRNNFLDDDVSIFQVAIIRCSLQRSKFQFEFGSKLCGWSCVAELALQQSRLPKPSGPE